jgi:hypothetical protein
MKMVQSRDVGCIGDVGEGEATRKISERMAKLRGKDVTDKRGMYHLRHAVRHVLRKHRGKSVTVTEGVWPERWTIIPVLP